MIGQDVAGSPLAQGIRKAGAAEKLTHTRDWNGSGCYFGMFCHGRSFDLYAYTDEKIIFREALLLILTVLVSGLPATSCPISSGRFAATT